MAWAATLILVFLFGIMPSRAQLTITTPNGGEVFDVGQTVTLRWTGTAFPDSVSIDYSTDAGSSWTSIVRNWQQTTYRWLVPNTPSTQCLLRVTGPKRTTGSGVVQLRDNARPSTIPHMSIDLTNDATRAVVADDDGYVMLFDAVTGALLTKRQIQQPTPSGARVVRAVLSSDETWVAALTEEDTVFILRMPDLAVLDHWATRIAKRVPLEDRWIATQPGGSRVAVSSFTHSRTYERNGTVVAELTRLSASSNTCIDWTPDGSKVVVSSGTEGHYLADATTGSMLSTFVTPSFYGFVSPNGQYLASQAKNTQAVLIRDLASGATIGSVPSAPGIYPFGIAWYPDNTIVRNAGASGGRLERFNVDGTIIDTLTSQPFGFGSTCFNSTGSVIGGASGGFSVVIRTTATPTAEQDVSNAVWEIRAAIVSDTATLSIDSVRTTTLRDMQVPIRLAPSNATILAGLTSLDVDVAWNATLAEPKGGTAAGSIVNGVRMVTITVPVVPISADVVAYLDLRTALGNDSATVLRIVDVRGSVDPTRIRRTDGRLLLTDLCASGGLRLMNGDGTALLMAQQLGDVLRAEWTTIEDGACDIVVMDVMGRTVARQWSDQPAGNHSTTLDIRPLASGMLFVILRTPTMSIVTPVQVMQ
ncbi:MAG: hypothetical protein JSS89_10500 [Bacteroidetes bacterium]|nr:hypothetical protein [Bacteroidota bacterium]